MSPTHRRLREATGNAHTRVDSLFGRFDLTRRDDYAALLAAHADAVLPVEALLDRGGAERLTADWPQRRRGPSIRADLAALGAPVSVPEIAGAVAEIAAMAGMLYVLEGSRLGARFLARGVPDHWPRAYLSSHQPSHMWPELLAKIDSLLYEPQLVDVAVIAANQTFGRFEAAGARWLDKVS